MKIKIVVLFVLFIFTSVSLGVGESPDIGKKGKGDDIQHKSNNYSQKEEKKRIDYFHIKNKEKYNKYFFKPIEREKIISLLSNNFLTLDDTIKFIKEFTKRSIKIDIDKSLLFNDYVLLKEKIKLIKVNNKQLLDSLNIDQKELLNNQIKRIENSEKRINQNLSILQKEFENENQKNQNKRAIISSCVEIEKELSNIDRQYRAIQWLMEEL